MRFRSGYRRRDPDPITPGLMSAAPRPAVLKAYLPRPRWHPLCAFRHRPVEHKLTNRGERWAVFVSMCRRCHSLLGEPHATKSDA